MEPSAAEMRSGLQNRRSTNQHESHWKTALGWQVLKNCHEQVHFWKPFLFPTDWNVSRWFVMEDELHKAADGKFYISGWGFTDEALTTTDYSWVPKPMVACAIRARMAKIAAADVFKST